MTKALANICRPASILGAACLVAAMTFAAGQISAEPPLKKSARRSQPARASQTSPDTTATITKPQSQKTTRPLQPQASVQPDDPAPPPFYLADVPRARMRSCGELWHSKKMAGSTGADDWRDFAIKCLAATDMTTLR